ncbi:MAG: DUF167 domain-containing protein [Desulfuromonadales bacterium]|jgi:uncharacterized protein (TIGR00251 family)|nr:DUF167 domain-containing protein [Desulfuromonadales bacterium]
MNLPCLRQVPEGVEVRVFVQPRASRNKLVGLLGDELKVALTAPPVDGAANKACCVFFAKLCGLPKSSVRVLSGDSSRHKRLLLAQAEYREVASQLRERAGG